MMAQDEEEGEEGEDYVDKVIRSLPDDTTKLVSNHLKDVLVGVCVHTHTHTTTTHTVHMHPVLCCVVLCCVVLLLCCVVLCCYCVVLCCVVTDVSFAAHAEWGQGVTERTAETGTTGRQLQHSVEWS